MDSPTPATRASDDEKWPATEWCAKNGRDPIDAFLAGLKLGADREREACTKVADDMQKSMSAAAERAYANGRSGVADCRWSDAGTASDIAATIRARGEA